MEFSARGEIAHFEGRFAGWFRLPGGEELIDFAAHHQRDEFAMSEGGGGAIAHDGAVAQRDDVFAEAKDVSKGVCDVDDSDAAGAEAGDEFEEALRFACREGSGR